jgi:Transmembrane secretion effector
VTNRFRRFVVDTAPLRLDRDYRWLWSGQVVSGVGTQITRLALPYQVYTLTGSTVAIAGLILCQLIPILAFGLGAGALVDAIDRRRVLLVTQAGLAGCSLVLVLLAASGDPSLGALYAVGFVAAGLSAFDQPARGSAIPRLVPAIRLPAAIALNQLNFQAASIVGPALGGILIATVGLTGAYAVDLVSFLAAIGAVLTIQPLPPLGAVQRPGLRAIREGLAFVRHRPPILGTFVIDLIAMVFAMPTALFPVLALDVFKVGPAGLGIMAAAPAVGAFIGAVFSGWVSSVIRVGRAVVLSVVGWGLAITGFGVTTLLVGPWAFPLALVMLAIAGAADMLSAVFRGTIVQLGTPDGLRGRVTSIHILVVTAGPRIGDIESALLAAVIGPGLTVIAGGLLCLAGVAAMGRWLPELGRHVQERPRAAEADRRASSSAG